MVNHSLVALCLFSGLGLIVGLNKWRRAPGFFLIFSYSLACAVTLGSIFQNLYPSYVLLLTLVIFLGMAAGLKTNGLALTCCNGWSLFLLSLLYLSFVSFQVLEGFLEGQDGRAMYLPMSRLLSQEPNLPPEWYYEALPNFSICTGYPPALIGITSLLFNLSGSTAEELAAFVPAVFFIGFLTVLLQWCKEEEVSIAIPAGLVLLSPFFIEKLSWFGYESPLVFSTTLLVYALWKFSKNNNDQYLFYAMLGSALALMSKYTGFCFTLLLMFYILRWKGVDKKVWGTFFLIHLVPALWYLRNVYYFGSPVPPFLNFLTLDPQFRTDWEGHWLLGHEEAHVADHKRLINLALNSISIPLLLLWAAIFPFTAIKKEVVYKGVHTLFCVFLFFWLTYNPDMRYIMPFYGVALVHLSGWTQGILKRKVPAILALSPLNWGIIIFTLFLSNLCGQYVYTRHIHPDRITPSLRAMRFLVEEERAGTGTRVFTDTDHILAWRAGWVVFDPATPKLAPDFLKARGQKDFYGLMSRYSIQYIINHPWNSPWEEDVFTALERDSQHFKEVYKDTTGVRVWRVMTDSKL